VALQFRIAPRPIVAQAWAVTTAGSDTLSSAFSSQTRYVRLGVAPATTAYVLATFGAGTPATSTASIIIPAGTAEVFAVGAGEKVAIKSSTGAITCSITEVE
jgi:hypothetical protein